MVATLDANGHPATYNGTWVEVPRSALGNAQFTVKASANTNFNFNGFSEWDMKGIAATQTANFFAIVVGFGAMTAGDTISINSISVVPGDIATRPAPQSIDEVSRECKYYYQKSFAPGTLPAAGIGVDTGENTYICTNGGGQPAFLGSYFFEVAMNRTPTIVLWNPGAGGGAAHELWDRSTSTSCSGTGAGATFRDFYISYTTDAGANVSYIISAHWTADARLGQ
jgi:hypothetical protein